MLIMTLLMMMTVAYAHDKHYAVSSEMKTWFDGLRSGMGPCCSDADGNVVKDADWESRDGHYRVMIDKSWIDVPDNAVITQPNLYGRTMVWPVRGYMGTSVRCFLPGALM